MEDYKFHSGGVIETLEKLQADFRAEKNEIDESEVKSVHEYDMYVQERNDIVKADTNAMKEAQKARAATIKEIASNSEQLSTVSADLLDDKQYAKELAELCESRAKTWDQRSKVRQDELSALTAATAVVKSTG